MKRKRRYERADRPAGGVVGYTKHRRELTDNLDRRRCLSGPTGTRDRGQPALPSSHGGRSVGRGEPLDRRSMARTRRCAPSPLPDHPQRACRDRTARSRPTDRPTARCVARVLSRDDSGTVSMNYIDSVYRVHIAPRLGTHAHIPYNFSSTDSFYGRRRRGNPQNNSPRRPSMIGRSAVGG